MATKDPAKKRAARARYELKKKIAKYGPEAAHVDMRGRHGNHATGDRNGKFKGGRFVTTEGYVAVRVPPDHPHAWGANAKCRYAYAHILLAEETMGRSLRDDERVHHKNEDKADNRLKPGHERLGCDPSCCNLEVLTKSEHAKEHDLRRGRDERGRFPARAGAA